MKHKSSKVKFVDSYITFTQLLNYKLILQQIMRVQCLYAQSHFSSLSEMCVCEWWCEQTELTSNFCRTEGNFFLPRLGLPGLDADPPVHCSDPGPSTHTHTHLHQAQQTPDDQTLSSHTEVPEVETMIWQRVRMASRKSLWTWTVEETRASAAVCEVSRSLQSTRVTLPLSWASRRRASRSNSSLLIFCLNHSFKLAQ